MRDSDFAHIFIHGTKLKMPSEIKPPFYSKHRVRIKNQILILGVAWEWVTNATVLVHKDQSQNSYSPSEK